MTDNDTTAATRAPATRAEHVLTNCRPQPAIPAVLAMLLLVLLPLMQVAGSEADAGTVRIWLVAAGLVSSAGLAFAAGLCSFAPQIIWLLLAAWAHSLLGRAEMPVPLFWLLYLAIACVAAGIIAQLWRVLTGRFVPTIRLADPDEEPLQ